MVNQKLFDENYDFFRHLTEANGKKKTRNRQDIYKETEIMMQEIYIYKKNYIEM